MSHRTRQLTIFLVIASVIALADLVAKEIAAAVLADGPATLTALGRSLRFVLVHNELSAFGISLGPFTREINAAATLAAIVLAVPACASLHDIDRWAPISLGLIAGAAAGNLVSMLTATGGVVDFIALSGGTGRELVVNLADIAAYSGALLLLRTVVIVWRRIRLERIVHPRPAVLVARAPLFADRAVPIPRVPLLADRAATAPEPSVPRDRGYQDQRPEL